jgi:non-specific serine/threonine protein kinase
VVLATSREPLRLRWERTLPLGPLALPDPAHLPPLEQLARVPAVALFLERARAARPGFALTAEDASTVARLVERLDGLPLAIELAAARAAMLGPTALLARLEHQLPLPGRGEADAPERHRTLQAAIAWSHDLLAPEEQVLFRRLAPFAGGWTLEAAEAVAGEAVPDVLEGLTSLADKSLVQVAASPGGEPRFRLLETIRAFALERLEASGDLQAVRDAHARFFLARADAVTRDRSVLTTARPLRPMNSLEHRSAFEQLVREHDNHRAALGWAAESGQTELLTALVGALWPVWNAVGVLSEGLAWLDRALAAPGITPAMAVRNRLHFGLASLCARRGDPDRAQGGFVETLARARAAGDAELAARAEIGLGIVAAERGDADLASRLLESGLAGARAADDPRYVTIALTHLGRAATRRGDLETAARVLEEALQTARSSGDRWTPADTLYHLSAVRIASGEPAAAQASLLEAARLYDAFGDSWGLARCLQVLGRIHLADGADADRATRLLGAADALRRAVGGNLPAAEREAGESALTAARRVLGAEAAAAAWREGALLGPKAAIDLASIPVQSGRPAPAPAARGQERGLLSAREREVLALVAEGKSNREIAEALIVSENTAKYHVAQLFNKLGTNSRAEAVARAVALGLLAPQRD